MRSLGATIVRAVATKTPDTPVPFARDGLYSGRLFGGAARDRDALMRTIESNGTLFSIVNRTSTAVASVNWRLYRKTPNPQTTTERVEVQSHAMLDLLDAPNAFMSGAMLFEATQQHVDLCGEGYWIISRASGFNLPLELWPVMPSRMDPVPSSTKFLAGWIYTGPNGEQIPLENNEVIQFKMPHPRDPYRGLGPVQAMLTELDAYRYSVEWNRNFFVNSAQPGGIIQVDKRLGDDEWTELVDRWNEQHKGVQRAHRVAVIEQGEWITNQISMVDMQFAELHTQSRDDLFVAFGISGSVMGVTEDVNRANAEAGKAMFAELLTCPRADRFRGQINAHLLPMYGVGSDRLELDYDSPVPADVELDNATRTSKANAASVLVAAGWAPDDVLEAVELPPMEFVGPPAAAAQLAAAQATAEAAKAAAQQAPDAPEPAVDEDDEGDGEQAPATTPKAIALPRAATDVPKPDLTAVDEHWQAATAQVASDYQAQIAPVQRQQLLDQIVAHVDAAELAALGTLAVDTAAAKALLLAAMLTFADRAAQQASAEAMAQGATVTPVPATSAELDAIAAVATSLLGSDLATTAGRAAIRMATPGASGIQVADKVRPILAEQSDASVTAQLAGAMSAAQNKSRINTFTGDGAPRAELVATEVLDKNTCGPCSEEDGHSFGSTDDPDTVLAAHSEYPAGGYVGCQGWTRCRGTVTAIYPESGAKEGTA